MKEYHALSFGPDRLILLRKVNKDKIKTNIKNCIHANKLHRPSHKVKNEFQDQIRFHIKRFLIGSKHLCLNSMWFNFVSGHFVKSCRTFGPWLVGNYPRMQKTIFKTFIGL